MITGHVASAATPATTSGSTVTSGTQPPMKKAPPTSIDGAVHFTSQQQSMNKQQLSSSSSTKAASVLGQNASPSSSQSHQSNPAVATAQLHQQLKLERGRIARRELLELDAIERAFRDDMTVWAGPTKVIPHPSSRGGGDNNTQGWMYGGGYAGIGGRTWMEATSSSHSPACNDGSSNRSLSAPSSSSSSSSSFLLDDVKIVDKSLHANGLTRHDLTPKAYACFLEQARRFGLELLANARDYAIHAKRSNGGIQPSDLHLAAEICEDGGGGIYGVPSTLPNIEQLSELAQSINRVPLPAIPNNCYDGVVLPPVTEQLTARTYDVVDGARVAQRMMRGGDAPHVVSDYGLSPIMKAVGDGADKKKSTVGGSYGAARGRQIAVVIKGKDATATDAAGGGAMMTTSATTSTMTSAATNLGSSPSTSPTKPITKKGQKRGLKEL